jgi:octaprenyl-diphosphate synthase
MQRSPRNTPSDSFLTRIDSYRAQVDLALHNELLQRQDSPFFAPFVEAFTGGKRLRSIIVLLAYDSVIGRTGDPLPAAVAVELMHMESLIHDDIIDGDGMRRNAKAFHALHGQEMALLSADFILSMILSITARYGDARITSALANATADMCEGELTERFIYQTKKAVHPDVYQEMVSKKTASLFEAAATIGALIGGGTRGDVSTLAAYARALGVAYQIHDDLIDWVDRRTNVLDLNNTHCSQSEYLRELLAANTSNAIDSLRPLKRSEEKLLLVKLAQYVNGDLIPDNL